MIVCGTGHRPDKLGGYDCRHRQLIALICAWLESECPDQVISGGALGFDTYLVKACIQIGMEYVLAIPFIGQESVWRPEQKKYYEVMKENAKQVVIVSKGTYSVDKMHIRDKWMVNEADHVLALWNGTNGGTSYTVRYANEQCKPLTNLWNRYDKIISKKGY